MASLLRRKLLQLLPASLLPGAERHPEEFQVRPAPLFAIEQGRLKRMLSAAIADPDWASGSIEIRAGANRVHIPLRHARRSGARVLLPVDAAEQETVYFCTYRNGARKLETRTRAGPERQWKVYIVHNSHQDPGFDDLPSVMRERFVAYLDEAAGACRANTARPDDARFRWNIEAAYLLEDYRKARGEEAFRKIIELLRSGAMALGAQYADVQTELLGLEPLQRIAEYAGALAREFGFPLRAAILDDVPGMTWGLADALARAGVDYLLWGHNPIRSNVFLDAMPFLFWWEGPAGHRVLVWRSWRYREGMPLTTWRGNRPDLSDPEDLAVSMLARYTTAAYPYDSILLQAAADFIHPYPELSPFVESWNAAWSYPRLRLSTLPEFFDDVERRHGAAIPVLRGGCPDAWNDQRAAMAEKSALARRMETALPDAEKWASLAAMAGAGQPGWSAGLNRAYRDLLMFDEHTLGWNRGRMDIYVDEAQGGGKRHYQEKSAYVDNACAAATRIGTDARTALALHIARKRPALAVWNPLSWPTRPVVQADLPQVAGLRDTLTGAGVACQKTATGIVFLAPELPPLGYRVLEIERAGASAAPASEIGLQGAQIQNRYYRLRFHHTTGAVASLLDTQTGQELVDEAVPHGLHQLVYVISRAIDYRHFEDLAQFRPEGVRLRAGASGPVFTSVIASGSLASLLTFEQEVVLYSDVKRIDFITRVRKKPVYTKEGLYLAFPFRCTAPPQFGRFQVPLTIDVPGGWMRPDIDQLGGTSRDYYVAQHGVHLRSAAQTIFWTSLDAPVFELGGIQSNRWNTRLTGDTNDLAHPAIYSYLMNNHWPINAPIAQGGELTFRYGLTSRDADWPLVAGKRFGWELASPPAVTTLPEGAGGEWPVSASLARLEPDNAAIIGIKTAGDGIGWIVRVAEMAGLDTTAALAIEIPGRPVTQAWLCDGREEIRKPLPVKSGAIEIHLAPFDVNAVRVGRQAEVHDA